VYLGTEELLAKARGALATLRAPRQQARQLRRARRALRQGQRAAQDELRRQLSAVGLVLKGTEFRGWSGVAGEPLARAVLSADPSGASTSPFLEKREFVDQLEAL
jgi:hypothetical protein